MLHTARLLLVPLADRHLELEVELDSDPEVLRFISGRAHTREEVETSHAERMALGRKVPGLGYFMAFGTQGGAAGSTAPQTEEAGHFVGTGAGGWRRRRRSSCCGTPSRRWACGG
jgi:hypothetical protein